MSFDRRRFLVAPLAVGAVSSLLGGALAAAQDGKPASGGAQGGDIATKLSYPKMVVLVRHAERAEEPKADPVLSEDGVKRAERLAAMLRYAGVTHLVASEFQRTQQTLAPLALAVNVRLQIAKAADAAAAQSAIETLPRGSVVVIAGHSNTVPALAKLLTGGSAEIKMAEAEFDRLFVVTQWGPGRQSSLLELRY
jgi:phosphohistidine phosphatase SixA